MRKVLVITQTTNVNSGWGRYSCEIVKNLKEKTEVFTLEEGVGQDKLYKKDSAISFLRNLFLSRKLAKDVDIVHVLDGWPFAVYGHFAVFGTSKALFINAVGTYSIPPNKLFSIKSLLMKMSYKRVSKIFSISKYTDKVLRSVVPWVNSTVVHLGVSKLTEPSKKSINFILSEIDSKSPVILTVGALKKRKGQIYTLKAISILKKTYPNILYVMVGDNADVEYKEEIISYARENHLENNILITGLISEEELTAWYKNADVFALNSINHDGHFEGFGLVVLESYQFGLPVVASRDCGIEDVIKDGRTGRLVNQRDPVDITRKIQDVLLEGKNYYADYCLGLLEKFDWKTTTSIYSTFYQKMSL